jgi:DNA replication and repair protein RecF
VAPSAVHLELRDFRNYERARVDLGPGLTVVVGANGAGKTNLLEGLYFGLTGRSCRTSAERELVRAGAPGARVVVGTLDAERREHLLEVGFVPGEQKRLRIDGASVDGVPTACVRPLVSVFMPDRLALVKGAPSGRRAHLDRLAAALWPACADTRVAYARALAQRNAAIARVRAGAASRSLIDPWDAELARHGIDLMRSRAEAADLLAPRFAARAAELGLPEPASLAYAPRSRASTVAELRGELEQRRDSDFERGFTAHGPHRDELALAHGDRSLRAYGSQGQQRVGLLALLFAERDALASNGSAPIMLLDDVTSELDAEHRALLVQHLSGGGQALITATEADHLPEAAGRQEIAIRDGRPLGAATGGERAA